MSHGCGFIIIIITEAIIIIIVYVPQKFWLEAARLFTGRYAGDVAHYRLLQPQQTSSLGHPDAMWQHRPAYAPVMQSRPVVPMPRTSARSTDTSSQSGPDERERKEMPRSYFYKALKLPSGRLVDIRYRNKYIRKWARKEAGGEPCQICCAVFMILLLLTILYVYLSNQVTPKHSSQAPFDQKSAESTAPFTDTTQEVDESSTVEGFSATVIEVTFDPSRDSSVSDAAAEEARLMSRAAEQFEARSVNKTTA
ncbi:hypothetical protein HPB51_004527 [Rhipicephalus microplus]|uniref:Uncharacterized protein n=1 Tax=Rhipicephalus microplus TaxID=6941 RepID=A0A9J6ELQ7_RHIMP|nr:hypothetical protein HPB51_004527 [Rhipicephalus microplus]